MGKKKRRRKQRLADQIRREDNTCKQRRRKEWTSVSRRSEQLVLNKLVVSLSFSQSSSPSSLFLLRIEYRLGPVLEFLGAMWLCFLNPIGSWVDPYQSGQIARSADMLPSRRRVPSARLSNLHQVALSTSYLPTGRRHRLSDVDHLLQTDLLSMHVVVLLLVDKKFKGQP